MATTQLDHDAIILDYLHRKGHTNAEAALRAELALRTESNSPIPSASAAKALSLEEFAQRNTPRSASPAPKRSQAGQLLADAPSWEKGYEGLRSFVENSLDIHRPELAPLLLPVFVHSYLDLVLSGYREAADSYIQRFAQDHAAAAPHVVRLLSALRLPHHLAESDEASRWRTERYNIRLSERGWGLLLGWLQGGGLSGMIEGTENRGRDRVLAIINERVRVDTVAGPPSSRAGEFGLVSDFFTARSKTIPINDLDMVKLGPVALDPKLEREIVRKLRDEDIANGTITTTNDLVPGLLQIGEVDALALANGEVATDSAIPIAAPVVDNTKISLVPLVSPFSTDIPPHPSTYRTIDVAREVEKVREARKRICLGAEAFKDVDGSLVRREIPGANKDTAKAAKPSVCLFTIHDAGDSLTTTSFSEDSTLLAAGFSESYIRLWNLKGGKLAGMRNDFNSDDIVDGPSLRKLRNPTGPTSRKLIGHSGPVYATSFDPVPGSSGPPRYLLSCSHDTTIRLWSLDTFANVMVYRGHREPVWDVQWGPKGIYFASASRDKTARIWMSDKVAAVRIFVGHLSDVNCVQFHPNSLYLATGSADRTCRLWDIQRGVCVRVFVGHKGSVSCLAISPDGRWLASGSHDLTIMLWNLTTGLVEKTFTGHTSPIYSLSFSAESTLLISGGGDGTVRVWDVLRKPPVVATSNALSLVTNPNGRKKSEKDKSSTEDNLSHDLLVTLCTKRTPVLAVKFTPRNLCLAAGAIDASS